MSSPSDWTISANFIGDDNSTIILESQDEIFTDFVEYTPTWTGWGSVSSTKILFSRVGDKIHIIGAITPGTSTGLVSFTLPPGYEIDGSKLGFERNTSNPGQVVGHAGQHDGSGRSFAVLANTETATDKLYFGGASTGTTILTPSTSFGNSVDLSFFATVPIKGFNSNFNPLLSMPLVDFGTYSNVYSAKITNGGTAAIASQSESFIASVSRTGAGVVDITFNSGHFSQVPCIAVAGDTNSSDNELLVSVDSLSATATTIRTALDNGSTTDGDFWVTFTRQGSDFKPLPQPTAAVIKPAVAKLTDVKAAGEGGGNSTATSFNDRDLNTLEGEAWFVTLASNQFTLEPGTYKIDGTVPGFRTGAMHGRLYDVTNSKELMIGTSEVSDNSSGQGSIISRFGGTVTITASTTFKVQSYSQSASSTFGLGYYASPSTDSSIYTQVFIEKLK